MKHRSKNKTTTWKKRRKARRYTQNRRPILVFISHSWAFHNREYLHVLSQLSHSKLYRVVDFSVPHDIGRSLTDRELRFTLANQVSQSGTFVLIYDDDVGLSEWMLFELMIANQIPRQRKIEICLGVGQCTHWKPDIVIDNLKADISEAIHLLRLRSVMGEEWFSGELAREKHSSQIIAKHDNYFLKTTRKHNEFYPRPSLYGEKRSKKRHSVDVAVKRSRKLRK